MKQFCNFWFKARLKKLTATSKPWQRQWCRWLSWICLHKLLHQWKIKQLRRDNRDFHGFHHGFMGLDKVTFRSSLCQCWWVDTHGNCRLDTLQSDVPSMMEYILRFLAWNMSKYCLWSSTKKHHLFCGSAFHCEMALWMKWQTEKVTDNGRLCCTSCLDLRSIELRIWAWAVWKGSSHQFLRQVLAHFVRRLHLDCTCFQVEVF